MPLPVNPTEEVKKKARSIKIPKAVKGEAIIKENPMKITK